MKNEKTRIRRRPDRGHYDKETIYRILDRDFVCQVGFVYNGYPVVIPTIYGREGDSLFFHGANVSRMLATLEKGVPVSVNVTLTDGLVLARSAFHHSLNYESVSVFGTAHLVNGDAEKMKALKVISDQVLEGRWIEVRQPNEKELNVTKVLELKIDEASAKIRSEGVGDDKEDYDRDIWAGVVPIHRSFGKALPDDVLPEAIAIPPSVKKIENERI